MAIRKAVARMKVSTIYSQLGTLMQLIQWDVVAWLSAIGRQLEKFYIV